MSTSHGMPPVWVCGPYCLLNRLAVLLYRLETQEGPVLARGSPMLGRGLLYSSRNLLYQLEGLLYLPGRFLYQLLGLLYRPGSFLCRTDGFLCWIERLLCYSGSLFYRSEDHLAPYLSVGLLSRQMASCITRGQFESARGYPVPSREPPASVPTKGILRRPEDLLNPPEDLLNRA